LFILEEATLLFFQVLSSRHLSHPGKQFKLERVKNTLFLAEGLLDFFQADSQDFPGYGLQVFLFALKMYSGMDMAK